MLKGLVESVAALRRVHYRRYISFGYVIERAAAEQCLHHVLCAGSGYADTHVIQGAYVGFKILLAEMVGNTAEVVKKLLPVHVATAGKVEQRPELRGNLQEYHITERQ